MTSVISQIRSNQSVDLVTTLIAAGAGAVGGALTASGVPIGGQIVGNAFIAFSGDYLTQEREIALGTRTHISKTKLLESTAVGAVCSLISGPGASYRAGGQNNMINLGVNTVKRTWNALTHKGIKAYITEVGKATKYYCASTASITANLLSRRNAVAQLLGGSYNIAS